MLTERSFLFLFPFLGTGHCPKAAAKAAMLEAYMQNLDGCWFQRKNTFSC